MARSRTRNRKPRAVPDRGAALGPLRLAGLPSFSDLSPSPEQLDAFARQAARLEGDASLPGEPVLGCVVRLDRGYPVVATERATLRCEYGQGLSSLKTDARAAVGDWVVCRATEGHDAGLLLEGVLPRRSDIARWRGGPRGEHQTLAANVDVVLVAQPLSRREVLVDRIARSVVVALDCGAEAAVVLTKADRCPDAAWLAGQVALVREVLGGSVPVTCTAAEEREGYAGAARGAGAGWGVAEVRALVPEGRVAIMLGESGAGKSTLLNALFGEDVLEVGGVRASDDAGRHTTVSRRMVRLAGAGVVVDEPGLRSLPLVGHERGLAKAFPDVAEAARACRFRDCTHTGEPGCGVRAALAAGAFPEARLDAYLSLAREMRESSEGLAPDVVI